mmetsp:Transcript_12104/g.29556  ORF Transcript_12104/g.29556 Transcript_12104/m.29556 type:complete len:87 (-) Transcript_12104:1109-1369(-)
MTTIAATFMYTQSFLMRSTTNTAFSLSNPEVISSRKRIFGFIAMAHARANLLRSPPDSPLMTMPPARVPPIARFLAAIGMPTRSRT